VTTPAPALCPREGGVRAFPPMQPTAKARYQSPATCRPGTGSPNAQAKLRASRLKLRVSQALSDGRPLLRSVRNPNGQHKESPWFGDDLGSVSLPRDTLFIGARLLDSEPIVGQSSWGAAKQACLDALSVAAPKLSGSRVSTTSPISSTKMCEKWLLLARHTHSELCARPYLILATV